MTHSCAEQLLQHLLAAAHRCCPTPVKHQCCGEGHLLFQAAVSTTGQFVSAISHTQDFMKDMSVYAFLHCTCTCTCCGIHTPAAADFVPTAHPHMPCVQQPNTRRHSRKQTRQPTPCSSATAAVRVQASRKTQTNHLLSSRLLHASSPTGPGTAAAAELGGSSAAVDTMGRRLPVSMLISVASMPSSHA